MTEEQKDALNRVKAAYAANNDLEIENAKLREALNSIVAASHSWVIRQETAELEIPIHQRYRKIATEALASKKDSKE